MSYNLVDPVTGDLTRVAGGGSSIPVGTLIQQYKKKPLSGYLYCDGSTFDENAYPALYMYLGTNVLPDYRECVMVGAEQNTTDTIATHDVYGEGEFKDDQLQKIEGTFYIQASGNTGFFISSAKAFNSVGGTTNLYVPKGVENPVGTSSAGFTFDSSRVARSGETTHGKQKAVYVYIKATSGLVENQQENVLRDVKDYAFDKSKIRTGIVSGGSADSDDWYATFDTPFADSKYTVIVTPFSESGEPFCPTGWYVVESKATGFRLYCKGNAPKRGFQYIAIHN